MHVERGPLQAVCQAQILNAKLLAARLPGDASTIITETS